MNYIYWPITKVLPEAQDISEHSHAPDRKFDNSLLDCATQSKVKSFRQPLEVAIIRPQRNYEGFDSAQSKIRKVNR